MFHALKSARRCQTNPRLAAQQSEHSQKSHTEPHRRVSRLENPVFFLRQGTRLNHAEAQTAVRVQRD